MTSTSSAAEALTRAAHAASMAPSVHNTQPWRWRVFPEWLELHTDRSRQLGVADPESRLMTISCGAGLHHARVALAVDGWQEAVVRLPDPENPDHLARVSLGEHVGVTDQAMRQFHSAQHRRTDRRSVIDVPVPPDVLASVRAAVEGEHNHLHLLHPEQLSDLAVAAGRADVLEAADGAMRAELGYWIGGERPSGAGVPDTVIPATPPAGTVPQRDLGTTGTLSVGAGTDRAASYGLIFGNEDSTLCWLRAGEALSAAWLTAADNGVSVVPFTAPMEISATRTILHQLLAGVGHPYLVLRMGTANPDEPVPAHPPRLEPSQTVEIVENGA